VLWFCFGCADRHIKNMAENRVNKATKAAQRRKSGSSQLGHENNNGINNAANL